MQRKLPFRSVVSLVIGSQIGSGVFLLPASLAAIGPISLFGWLLSGSGAILLALVFAQLSMLVAKEGGPHAYMEKAFGRKAAFFTAWTYWLISWVSSIAVIVAAVGYLSSLIPISTPFFILCVEIAILLAITYINVRGAVLAGSLELFLTVVKCLPLIVVPLVAFFFLEAKYFQPINPHHSAISSCLNAATLMTFWGFVGLETAATTSAIVENPTKTVPRAILIGTLSVVAIYLLNSFAIMGVVPQSTLVHAQAPYAIAAQITLGNGWNAVIALIAFIACLGTLNAWILTSGQIAVAAAREKLFPPLFAKINRFGAPHTSLWIACLCTLPLLMFTLTPNILEQLNSIIDISVTTFLFIYLACAIAFIKIILKEGFRKPKLYLAIAGGAICFCLWVLAFVPISHLFLCSLFVFSGIPIYFWQKNREAYEPIRKL